MADEPTNVTPAPKPGWKTSEFWKGIIAMTLIALTSSDTIPMTGLGAQITVAAGVVIVFLGYGQFRTMLKKGAS